MATTVTTTTYERIDYGSEEGAQFGGSASDKIALWGATPASRRAFVASRMDTTAVASSSDFGAGQLAVLHEIMNTLRGLGAWPTA
jgi:hypothetical protein